MRKKDSLPILVAMLLVVMAGAVLGTATFEQPITNARISGSYVFNVTAVTATMLHNCTITGSSSNSGDTLSATVLYNNTDATGGLTANATIDTTALNDAADWTFTGTCYNTTGGSESITAITGVDIDNTLPGIGACQIESTAAASTQEISDSTFIFTCYVNETYACNVYWKDSTAHAFSTSAVSWDEGALTAETLTSSYTTNQQVQATLHGSGDVAKNTYMDCTDGTNTTTGTTYAVSSEGIWEPDQQDDDDDGFDWIIFDESNKKFVLMASFGVFAIFLLMVAFFMKKKK